MAACLHISTMHSASEIRASIPVPAHLEQGNGHLEGGVTRGLRITRKPGMTAKKPERSPVESRGKGGLISITVRQRNGTFSFSGC